MKKLLLALSILVSVSAQADIFDRIDNCEKQGGGACTFNLLRELAKHGQESNTEFGGLYTRVGGKAFCETHLIVPNVSERTLLGFTLKCEGGSYSEFYPCTQNICKNGSFTLNILNSKSYTLSTDYSTELYQRR